jgi:hypothetical protein
MGPPDRRPPLPRYDFFEDLEEGESFFSEVPVPGQNVTGLLQKNNWLQSFENAVDPVHAAWLHYAHSGPQFAGTGEPQGAPHSFFDPYTIAGKLRYEKTERGVMYHQWFEREEPDGTTAKMESAVEVHLPNIIVLPDFVVVPGRRNDCLIMIVPADDTSFRAFFTFRAKSADRLLGLLTGIKQNGKLPWEMTEDERQRYPGDLEAQVSQGPITQHSEETLVTSDKGIVMLRRLLRQMTDDVEAGRDPQNADPSDDAPRSAHSGYFAGATTAS